MTRLSVFIATSIDGYIATLDGSLDWLERAARPDEDYGFDEFLASVDALAMGRGTYDHIAHLDPLPFGERPVYVFTHRPPAPRAHVHFIRTDPAGGARPTGPSRASTASTSTGAGSSAHSSPKGSSTTSSSRPPPSSWARGCRCSTPVASRPTCCWTASGPGPAGSWRGPTAGRACRAYADRRCRVVTPRASSPTMNTQMIATSNPMVGLGQPRHLLDRVHGVAQRAGRRR